MPPKVIKLHYQAPYHWSAILQFLGPRLVAGLELVTQESYRRIGDGWSATVTHQTGYLVAEIEGPAPEDTEARLRHLFDVAADIGQIEAHLSQFLALSTHRRPGLRLPG